MSFYNNMLAHFIKLSNTAANILSVDSEGGLLAKQPGSKIYYGTCSTTNSTTTKVVTTFNGDFKLAIGAMIRIKFEKSSTSTTAAKLKIDDTQAITVSAKGDSTNPRYFWLAGEVVDFVYDGERYMMVNGGEATTTYYGVTKLEDSVASTSKETAATPNSVKMAYDIHNTEFENVETDNEYTQAISATSSCRFIYTQISIESGCVYDFVPAAAGYVWYVIINKPIGNTAEFSGKITLDQDIDASWTRVDIVFIAQSVDDIFGYVIGHEE